MRAFLNCVALGLSLFFMSFFIVSSVHAQEDGKRYREGVGVFAEREFEAGSENIYEHLKRRADSEGKSSLYSGITTRQPQPYSFSQTAMILNTGRFPIRFDKRDYKIVVSLAKYCVNGWSSSICKRVLSDLGVVFARDYRKRISFFAHDNKKQDAYKTLGRYCSSTIIKSDEDLNDVDMSPRITSCVNGVRVLSENLRVKPDQNLYQFMLSSTHCLKKVDACSFVEGQLKIVANPKAKIAHENIQTNELRQLDRAPLQKKIPSVGAKHGLKSPF